MVAYSFKDRFAPAILAGVKDQTIRSPRLARGHAATGNPLHLYTGMRTKQCRLILKTVCIGNFYCVLRWQPVIEFAIDGERIPVAAMDAFARRDGFRDVDEMAAFWRETHGDIVRFAGVLIRWQRPSNAADPFAPVAQGTEQHASNVRAAGSNPAGRSISADTPAGHS